MAIGRGLGSEFSADGTARTRAVIDDEGLPPHRAHVRARDTRDNIHAAAGTDIDNDAHRSLRIRLRLHGECGSRQHRYRQQRQKFHN